MYRPVSTNLMISQTFMDTQTWTWTTQGVYHRQAVHTFRFRKEIGIISSLHTSVLSMLSLVSHPELMPKDGHVSHWHSYCCTSFLQVTLSWLSHYLHMSCHSVVTVCLSYDCNIELCSRVMSGSKSTQPTGFWRLLNHFLHTHNNLWFKGTNIMQHSYLLHTQKRRQSHFWSA